MSMRKNVNGFTISTNQYGNVFETIIINKYGATVRARTDFTSDQAKATHFQFCSLCK